MKGGLVSWGVRRPWRQASSGSLRAAGDGLQAAMLVVMVVGLSGLTGCLPIAPSRPMPGAFVEVDGGQGWLQAVCGEFSAVEVVQESDLDPFEWRATATGPGVDRIRLLALSLPGYDVEQSGALDPAEPAWIRFEGSVSEGGFDLALADVGSDQVGYHGGVVSRAVFRRLSPDAFGC